MTIKNLKIGQSAEVLSVGGEGSLRQHFLDMGVVPGARVTMIKRAPSGDPIEILVQGYSLTLRDSEADRIEVRVLSADEQTQEEVLENDSFAYNESDASDNPHPGLGEGGIYHQKGHSNPVSEGQLLSFALVGQQNSGKTTLFNQLTGSNQHVGNFPGVTVDRKDGPVKGFPNTVVTDLPGIYSLSTYTQEELVSRNFIIHNRPSAIINIVDANNIERNLYLTMQLMELDVPVVLALNMMDELRGNGGSVRINEMERALGIPVVAISAAKNEGVEELVEHALHIARYDERPARQDFCSPEDHGGAVHRCLHIIMHLIEDHAVKAGLPIRFAASRLAEGDEEVLNALNLSQNEKETLEHIILQMEEERGLDRHAAMADMRYSFIHRLCSKTISKPHVSKERIRSNAIDRVLTGKWTAIPAFIAIIALVFWLTFDVIGAWLQDVLDQGIALLGTVVGGALSSWGVAASVQSLVVDAIFGGVGTVISFVPIVVVLFFFLSLLEDSGYMARIAFVSDSLLRKIGLSGRSIVPLLISFGCGVPGVMAARTLPSARDRKMTIMLTPFMSCSAKIAIYSFFAAAFFPGHAGVVMISLYLFAILVGIVVALFRKRFGHKSEPAPFVMELPTYRIPQPKNVGHLLWDKTKDFLQRAFTVIFLATLVIWFLQSFDFRLNYVPEAPQSSMLATVAGLIAPVFEPLGLGDWRIVTSLISGFLAKESVVSTLEITGAAGMLTTLTAIPMLVFCLLYTPCVAAIAAIRRELGRDAAVYVVLFQCAVAWLCAWLAYLVFGLFVA